MTESTIGKPSHRLDGVAVLNGLQIISRGTSPPLLSPAVALRPPSVLATEPTMGIVR